MKSSAQANWDSVRFQVDNRHVINAEQEGHFYGMTIQDKEGITREIRHKPGLKSVQSDSDICTQRSLGVKWDKQPNLLFQPFIQRDAHSIGHNSPLHSDSNYARKLASGSKVSANSSCSGHTFRQQVSPRIHDAYDLSTDDIWPDDYEEEKREEDVMQSTNVTFEQLREYDKLVTQLIKDQINQENRQRALH
jgi:hypothetical protein